MKKIIFSLSLIAFAGATCYARRDKTVRFKSTKTDYANTSAAVQETKNDRTEVRSIFPVNGYGWW